MDAGGNGDRNTRPLSQRDATEATATVQTCAVASQSQSRADYFFSGLVEDSITKWEVDL